MKTTTLKKVQFNSAILNLEAINVAYGMENIQTVDEEMDKNIKKFANDIIEIIQLSEKMKLMNAQVDQGCKGIKNEISIKTITLFKIASHMRFPAKIAKSKKPSLKQDMPSDV